MNYLFLLLASAFLLSACTSSDSKSPASTTTASGSNALQDSANFTTMEWLDSQNQNIGRIKEGQTAEITWHFKNTGTKPLVIQNVAPGCGCTVADKPEEPIMPGKEALIKAKFDSRGQSEGEHTKSVVVYANTKDNPMHQLLFKVEVTK